MKRIIVWSSVVAIVIVAGAITLAGAEARRWCGHGWRHHGPLGYVVHELNLSDAQTSQIKSILQTERPAISGLVHEFAAEAREMDDATVQGNMDQSRVQEIASRQGATIAKVLVEKEQVKAKIYASVLNPEQRTKADELLKRWHSHLDRIADRLANTSGKE